MGNINILAKRVGWDYSGEIGAINGLFSGGINEAGRESVREGRLVAVPLYSFMFRRWKDIALANCPIINREYFGLSFAKATENGYIVQNARDS